MFLDDISGGRQVLTAAAICFTDKGESNALRVKGLKVYRFRRDFMKTDLLMERFFRGSSLQKPAVIVFFSAAGIAVRSIAPYLVSKATDPAVIVVNDQADFTIPILSGHIGQANEAAVELARALGARAVITTASDSLKDVESVDVFAKRQGYILRDLKAAKTITADMVAGIKVDRIKNEDGSVTFVSSAHREAPLVLAPERYVIGLGCRRGIDPDKMRDFVLGNMEKAGISAIDVYKVCSIDIKADEPCMTTAARFVRAPFVVFSPEQLKEAKGNFTPSDFVVEKTGVDNVCERSAICGCGSRGGRVVIKKTARDGMTFAAAERNI
ncbi:MAG: cobalamin biosynthesis protein [Anaerovoracaceae bacterium]|nr:cobalamin biosynthesis protein [Bacillota bacterium]MDY2670862.1 cobalamin biosynthesis protein [Anaerovoracaceae bacterium]